MSILIALSKRKAQPASTGFKSSSIPKSVQEEKRQAVATPVAEPAATSAAPEPQPAVDDEEPEIEPEDAVIPPELASLKLITETDLSADKMAEIETFHKNSPRPPSLLYEIFQHLTLGTYDAKEFSKLAGGDPVLGAKLIQTVNSPFFGLRSEVNSVQRAVIYLGFNYVKDIALRQAMEVSFKGDRGNLHPAYHKFWMASFVASALAFRLAKHLDMDDSAALATRSLMSYLGNLSILANRPEWGDIYLEKPGLLQRTFAEQDYLGFNAAIVGSSLASFWKLPAAVKDAIQTSLLPLACNASDSGAKDFAGLAVTYFSCRIADQVAFGGLKDIAEANANPKEVLELFRLPGYLKRAKAEHIADYLQEPSLRTEVNRVISQMMSDKSIQG
ncbi:MAG: HDOD domain-containing protein [bacterium]